jgi:hypothetical protein
MTIRWDLIETFAITLILFSISRFLYAHLFSLNYKSYINWIITNNISVYITMFLIFSILFLIIVNHATGRNKINF